MGKKILTDLEVKGYIDVDGGIKDANSDFGLSGQYLQTSGSDVVWANYNLQDAAVTGSKIASYAVTSGKLANNSVTADQLAGWKTYNVVWGTTQAGVAFQSTTTLRITHSLNTHFIIYSILDVSGTLTGVTNAYVDVNHSAEVYARKVNSNATDFIFNGDRTNGQVFKFSLFGHP